MDEDGPGAQGAEVRSRLQRVLDGYFDVRTSAMVERVVATATIDEVADAEAMDRLFTEFLSLLEARYDRADPGWREHAETFLKAEFDRQVESVRAFHASLGL